MKMFQKKKKMLTPEQAEEIRIQEFFDRIVPSTVRFFTDHFICGNSCKCVWAVRECPTTTEEQAILAHLADRNSVTLRIYNRLVDSAEQRQIVQHATRRNKLMSTTNDVTESLTAESNLQDVVQLIADLRRNKEPLLHCAVFIELKANSEDKLKELQSDILMELTRSKITVDRLILRQKEGMISAVPFGYNAFRSLYERVLPASSVANLYPLNYSGKTDEKGFYIGRDKFGTNILVDFDKRSDDKTNANVLILGNSGQGKSYLMKLLLTNLRESGKSVIILDAEQEYADLTNNLGGTYLDFMSGEYMINPLEPKSFGEAEREETSPEPFRKVTRLSQHISYLKDFFRAYKGFSASEIDTIEIMLMKLYARFDIDDLTDFNKLKPTDYPVMQDHTGGEYYLKHNFEGKDDNKGKPIVSADASIDPMDQNIVIFGHNVSDGSQFGDLDAYLDKKFYKNHPVITFDTIYETGQYQIVAVEKTNVKEKDESGFRYYWFRNYKNRKEFQNLLDFVEEHRVYDTGEHLIYGDTTIMLSNCEYTVNNGRLVVIAKRI